MRKFVVMFIVVIVIAAAGCSGGESPSPSTAKLAASNIVYSKDDRSGLCFGTIESKTYGLYSVVSITTVPCEKVERLLVK